MKIKCIAIEDEPLALKKLTEFIGEVDYLQLLESFDNAVEAVGFLKTAKVDLIFLDIRMKKLSGIQFLEALAVKPKIVITSAYDEYALKGYELDVADYLLKPFSFERFLKSVEKIHAAMAAETQKTAGDFIFVKTEYRIEKIMLDDIIYIRGMKDYLQICLTDKKIMTLQSFKNMMQLLPSERFVRVHNSYIVAVSKIDSVERNRIRIGNTLIPISESYRAAFYEKIMER